VDVGVAEDVDVGVDDKLFSMGASVGSVVRTDCEGCSVGYCEG